MTIKQEIESLREVLKYKKITVFQAVAIGHAIYRAEQEQDNRPLTLEQLKERVGMPIWITWYWAARETWADRGWYVPDKHDIKSDFMDGYGWHTYGKTWLAYDHKPER